jgi:hypothetical protein
VLSASSSAANFLARRGRVNCGFVEPMTGIELAIQLGKPIAAEASARASAVPARYGRLARIGVRSRERAPVAAGIPPMEISRFMGHANPSITLGIYAHLFEDDHEPAMSVLGALSRPAVPAATANVIPLRGSTRSCRFLAIRC